MKIQFNAAIAVLALAIGAPAFGKDANPSIIGVWRMTSLQVASADGKVTDIPYTGQVIFSAAGMLSVQAMDADPKAAPTPYTANGYEAYYGPVQVDQRASTFTITVESSLVRNLIGQKLTRVFAIDGDQLSIRSADPKESWRVTYKRMWRRFSEVRALFQRVTGDRTWFRFLSLAPAPAWA